MMLDRREIKTKIEALISKAGIPKSYPMHLVEIANRLGYTVGYFTVNEKTRNVAGAIDRDKKIIFLNPLDSSKRKAFTLAHELGHLALHDDGNSIDYRITMLNSNNLREREANIFAAEILMPEEEFVIQWTKFNEDIDSISDYFEASSLAVTIRAHELGLIKKDLAW